MGGEKKGTLQLREISDITHLRLTLFPSFRDGDEVRDKSFVDGESGLKEWFLKKKIRQRGVYSRDSSVFYTCEREVVYR